MSRENKEVERWRRDAERLAKIVEKHEPHHVYLLNHKDLVRRADEEMQQIKEGDK